MGDIDEARKDYTHALKLAPDNQLAKIGIDELGPIPTPEPEPSEEATESMPDEVEPPPKRSLPRRKLNRRRWKGSRLLLPRLKSRRPR